MSKYYYDMNLNKYQSLQKLKERYSKEFQNGETKEATFKKWLECSLKNSSEYGLYEVSFKNTEAIKTINKILKKINSLSEDFNEFEIDRLYACIDSVYESMGINLF